MKSSLHGPDYGPTHYDLNLDVSSSFRDYADGAAHLLFFIPAEFLLKSFNKALSFTEHLEIKSFLHRKSNTMTPYS